MFLSPQRRQRAKTWLLVLSMPLFFLTACFQDIIDDIDNLEDIVWNPTFALPLVNSTFTLEEFIEDLEDDSVEIVIGAGGDISVVYTTNVLSQRADELYTIPDQTFNRRIGLNGTLPVPVGIPFVGTIDLSESFDLDWDPEQDERIDSILFNSGNLNIDIVGNILPAGEVILTSSALISSDGQPFEIVLNWTAGNPNTPSVSIPRSLQGAKIDLTGGGTTNNLFQFAVQARLDFNGEVIDPAQEISIDFSFTDLSFQAIYGDLGTRTLASITEEVDLNLFQDLVDGELFLDDPQLTLEVQSSYGVSVGLDLSSFVATRNEGSEELALQGTITDNLQVIDGPDFSQIGQRITTTVPINKDNSNLRDLLAFYPETFRYDVSGTLNPGGGMNQNFVLDSSILETNVEVEVPLVGRVKNLVAEIDEEFEGQDFTEVGNAILQLNTRNEFPVEINVQVYFYDGNQLLDSLFNESLNFVEAAVVNAQGDVVQASEQTVELIFTDERLDRLSQANRLVSRVMLNTSGNDQQVVRFLSTHQVQVALGGQTQFEVNLNEQ